MLSARGLVKSYEGREVLHGVSFDVAAGEFLSILGPSGCGKTTTMRVLMGLEEADAGEVLVGGRDVTRLPPGERGMGIVFQDYALFENMTVRGNVEYAMRFRPDLAPRRREVADALLVQLGLEAHADRGVRKLSGGQQQRVCIARTLALGPGVVLLDEPMSALDVETRLSLRAELKRVQRETGTTMVYITHDQEEAFAMSDRVMVMGEGRVRQVGTPEEILDAPADAWVADFVVKNLRAKAESLARFVGR